MSDLNTDLCPCGSGQTYNNCCQPFISGQQPAPTTEALLRSRYTAYVKAEIDYIQNTQDISTRKSFDRQGAERWAAEADWLGLEIIEKQAGEASDDAGTIEFKANYTLKNKPHLLHELSEFKKRDGAWYFVDSKMPQIETYKREAPKVGRNDPCICGSGKKYKKCCG